MEDVYGRVGFDRDRLIVESDDDRLLRRLRRDRWSPSSAKTIHKCAARWAVEQVTPVPADPFAASDEGTAAHLVFERLFGLPGRLRTREQADQILGSFTTVDAAQGRFAMPDPDVEPDVYQRWLVRVGELVDGLWRIEDPSAVVVTGLERQLSTATVAGVPFNGFMDRTSLIVDSSGAVVGSRVDDYKTARKGAASVSKRERFGDDHGDQLRLYALALLDLDGRIPDQAVLLYTATGQQYRPDLSQPHLDRVAADFAESWQIMTDSFQAREWKASPSPLCGWCVAQSVCPAAAAAGRGSRDPKTVAAEQVGVTADRPSQHRAPAGWGWLPDSEIAPWLVVAVSAVLAESGVEALRRSVVLRVARLVSDAAAAVGWSTGSHPVRWWPQLVGQAVRSAGRFPDPGSEPDLCAWVDRVQTRLSAAVAAIRVAADDVSLPGDVPIRL